MGVIENLIAFLVVIIILVAVHEWGHYAAARACGVRVLRFSVGFGTPLIKRVDARGTEWVIGWMPLGGYVRMLQTDDAQFEEGDEHLTFDRTSASRRIIIAVAGPLANLLLAFVALWGVMMLGSLQPYAVTGLIQEGSIADRAGMREGELIVRVDGRDTPTASKVGTSLIRRIGEGGALEIETGRLGKENTPTRRYRLDISEWSQQEAQQSPLGSLGIRLSPQYIVGSVVEGSAAERAGIREFDRILAVDQVPMETYWDTVDALASRPDETLLVRVDRAGEQRDLPVHLGVHEDDGRGFLGVSLARQQVRYGAIEAIPAAINETYDLSGLLFQFIGKLITREVDTSGLGGPVAIAKVARESARMGLVTFLQVLALLSINLCLINLIPLPLLDGGHVLLASIEGVTQRRLPTQVQVVGGLIGIAFITLLMGIAIYNDVISLLK